MSNEYVFYGRSYTAKQRKVAIFLKLHIGSLKNNKITSFIISKVVNLLLRSLRLVAASSQVSEPVSCLVLLARSSDSGSVSPTTHAHTRAQHVTSTPVHRPVRRPTCGRPSKRSAATAATTRHVASSGSFSPLTVPPRTLELITSIRLTILSSIYTIFGNCKDFVVVNEGLADDQTLLR